MQRKAVEIIKGLVRINTINEIHWTMFLPSEEKDQFKIFTCPLIFEFLKLQGPINIVFKDFHPSLGKA